MYGKFRFSMNGFIYCLMLGMFSFNVTCVTCPEKISGGYINPFCNRLPGKSCLFICYPEFVQKGQLLTCGNNGSWIQDTNSICIKSVPCPAILNNGYIQSSCSRLPGDSCTFYCKPGFVKRGNQLTCGKDGMWIEDTNSICIKSIACPDEFNGGYIAPFCSRLPGKSCTFYCYPEFAKIGDWLTCGSNGSWIQDTNSNCVKSVTCPEKISGGYISPFCNRLPGNSCLFLCYPEFVQKGHLLTCGNNGSWIQDTNSICIKSDTCPDTISGGYIDPLCDRLPGDSCIFYCYKTFVKEGYLLTCGNNRLWIPDTNSSCIKSVEQTSSSSEPSSTGGQAHVSLIMAIFTPFLLTMTVIIILCLAVWLARRSSVRNSQRVPYHAGATCLNLTTRRQQPNTDVINSVSSFESPSYNGIYVRSFDQRIPSISSSCRYYKPPPSYSEIHIATNEAPPSYKEAVRDNTNFNMYI
ncbi:hypothetical protein ACJMK2_017304 [Sinanodonta woodiana]|uniref:Sushi domain-containing protein n=1 Tax=Sinanodonta woodiana TaxID=1069815 RepID=A0ABD3UZ44_SINWO